MSVTTAQAVTLLENVLFESATMAQSNAVQWVQLSQTNTGDSFAAGLAAAMSTSPEAGIAEQVVRYYEGALGRTPDVTEVAYYVDIAETGLSASQIAQGASGVPQATWNQIAGYFAASPEFSQLYSSSGSAVISALYENILGRSPAADETAFYQKALDGGTSVSTLVQYFVTSPEFQSKANMQIAVDLAIWGTEPVVSSNSGSSAASGSGVNVTSPVVVNPWVTETTSSSTNYTELISPALVVPMPLGEPTDTTVQVDGAVQIVSFGGFTSAELLQFVTVPNSGVTLFYTSGGAVHAVAAAAGITVDLPAGIGSIELTGIQQQLKFTLTPV